MIGPGPVSSNAQTKDEPMCEGSDPLYPLELDGHGTPAEWNQFFSFVYIPQYVFSSLVLT
jgi:hypothetical protein